MAAGSRTFSGSVKDSDFLYDFPCSPCAKDGRNAEGIKHCVDCNENLCVTCLTLHSRFAMTREHKVLDQVQTIQGQTKQFPSQRCSRHGGKIIDVFCPTHDAVGCSTCISVNHSACKGKQFIPDVADGFKTSRELKELETEIGRLKFKLGSLKKRKGENLDRLIQDKDALKKQIQSVRKKMNEQLDKMEKELLAEAEKKFQLKMDTIHASIAEVDEMLARVKQAMDQVKSDTHDADLLVISKILKQEMSNHINPLYTRVEKMLPERSLELHTDEITKMIMEGKRMLASIKEKFIVHKAAYKGAKNITMPKDEFKCSISGICTLPDGCLVMTDYWNRMLKMLNPVSNKVSALVNLPDTPSDVCLADNTRLAVSLVNQNKIQFVSIAGQVRLENDFSVGVKCACLAYCNGLMYVCCGGSRNPEQKETCVYKVYNLNGELQRCWYEAFGCPEYISVVNDGYSTTLYISDYHQGIIVRDICGAVKQQFPVARNTLLPFCLIGSDQLCIGEYKTGNIYLLSSKGKRSLIEGNEMKGEPFCLHFDDRSSRLFVSLNNSDVIKVFGLQM